jgi:hypothetical protein
MKNIGTTQDYRIAAVFRMGKSQPIARSIIETKLVEFAGLPARKAHQLAGHWFTTQAFKAIRA